MNRDLTYKPGCAGVGTPPPRAQIRFLEGGYPALAHADLHVQGRVARPPRTQIRVAQSSTAGVSSGLNAVPTTFTVRSSIGSVRACSAIA